MSRIPDKRRFFDAAIESARFFNGTMAEAAATAGIFDGLADWSSAQDVCRKMRFHPSKLKIVQEFLNILVSSNLVEKKVHTGQIVYRVRGTAINASKSLDGGLQRYQVKGDVLDPWQSEYHSDTVHDFMFSMIGDGLDFFRGSQRLGFNAEYIDVWRWNLGNPMYHWARMEVVKQLVGYGNKFLDLASGLGWGTQALANSVEGPCEVVCVDRSADFLAFAKKTILPNANVTHYCRDLNTGLPPELEDKYFDGILFNGAFHFIKDKQSLLMEMRRVLRPGGLLVIGHCFARSGFQDESMHDFYFSLIDLEYYCEPWADIRSYVSRAGFEETEEFHRGSHSYLVARRDMNPGPLPDSRTDGLAAPILFAPPSR